MSYTDSRGFTNTQRTTVIHRESSPRDSEYSYETRSSDYYTGSHESMSTRFSSNGRSFGGSGGERNVKYRDAAADKKYITGITSRSGNVHVIAHGDSHKHYDPAEPRASEGKESDYKMTSARYEREKSRPLNHHR